MKRKIVWEKYVNPLCTDASNIALPDEVNSQEDLMNRVKYNQLKEMEEEGFINTEDAEIEKDEIQHNKNGVRVLHTPFGLMPLNEYNTNAFNFWIGHTNFDISEEIANIIDSVPGVEVFEVYSRYRFRISIAKNPSFKPEQVKLEIEKILCGYEKGKFNYDTNEEIKLLSEALNDTIKYWFIYVFPNGKICHCFSNELNQTFKEEVEILSKCFDIFGGLKLNYDGYKQTTTT